MQQQCRAMGNLLVFGGSAGLSLIINQITNVYVARNMPISQIGQYVIALLVSTVLGILVDLGGRMYYATRLVKISRYERRRLYFEAIARRTTESNILMTAPFIVLGLILYETTEALLYGALICLVVSLYSNAFSFEQATGRGRFAQISNVAIELTRLLIVFLLSKISSLSGITILMIAIISSRTFGAIILYRTIPHLRVGANAFFGVRKIYRRSSNIFLSNVMSLINVKSGEMLVASILPAARVGELNIAMQIPAAGLRIFELVKASFIRRLNSISVRNFMSFTVTTIVILQFLMFVLSPYLQRVFVFIYGEKNIVAAPLFIGLSFWLIFSLANYMCSMALVVKGKSDLDLATNKLILFASIPVYAFLVSTFGLIGVIISMCLVAVLSLGINSYWLVSTQN
ncbi:lipopolysaccharide biosynthesis protein [Cupriavidus sp. TMH.W2]|uniref:lipopolysaccharide biosynthesis protein n=1 Tax=Cupriavidus sp. TMH.W2 TaxID=3434465 RepID=UPI003D785218